MSDTDALPETPAPEGPEPERWHGVLVERDCTFSRGQVVAFLTVEQYVEFVRTLRDEDGFWLCLDVTAVDYLAYNPDGGPPGEGRTPRFDVVYHLYSIALNQRVRL